MKPIKRIALIILSLIMAITVMAMPSAAGSESDGPEPDTESVASDNDAVVSDTDIVVSDTGSVDSDAAPLTVMQDLTGAGTLKPMLERWNNQLQLYSSPDPDHFTAEELESRLINIPESDVTYSYPVEKYMVLVDRSQFNERFCRVEDVVDTFGIPYVTLRTVSLSLGVLSEFYYTTSDGYIVLLTSFLGEVTSVAIGKIADGVMSERIPISMPGGSKVYYLLPRTVVVASIINEATPEARPTAESVLNEHSERASGAEN